MPLPLTSIGSCTIIFCYRKNSTVYGDELGPNTESYRTAPQTCKGDFSVKAVTEPSVGRMAIQFTIQSKTC